MYPKWNKEKIILSMKTSVSSKITSWSMLYFSSKTKWEELEKYIWRNNNSKIFKLENFTLRDSSDITRNKKTDQYTSKSNCSKLVIKRKS